MMRKFIAIGLILIIFCTFTGCFGNNETENKYNAKMYSHVNDWILPSFLEENKVRGAFYKNPDYDPDTDEWDEKYYRDENAPSSRVFIITEEDEYNRIFCNSPVDVDFKKEMIVLYIFSDVYSSRDYTLSKIDINDKVLTVEMELEHRDGDDAVMPYQRCIVIKMKRTDAKNVEFIKQ